MKKHGKRPHFSDTVLGFSEQAQALAMRTSIGRGVVSVFTGSSVAEYRQLLWHSQKVKTDFWQPVVVPADAGAGMLARNWNKAAVLKTNRQKLNDMRTPGSVEAVAYVSDKAIHVGVAAIQGTLFATIAGTESVGVAMRMNKNPIRATLGLWEQSESKFHGVETAIDGEGIATNSLEFCYPGLLLV